MRRVTRESDATAQPPRLTLARASDQLTRAVPLNEGQDEIPDLELTLRPTDPPPEAA